MTTKTFTQKHKGSGRRAQAMVEFAIALPVLLAILIGIMEIGRMTLMYALVTNASRDAVRYASAVGREDSGYFKYKYCTGIKAAAQASAYFVPLKTITISYYDKDGAYLRDCAGTNDDLVSVKSSYKVKVSVTADYSPMVKFLPIKTRPFTSYSIRTYLGVYDLPNP